MSVGEAALVGLVVGVLVGLVPLISGLVRNRRTLGIIGFVASAVSGAILGLLLALPVALVFTLAIFLMRGERGAQTGATV